MMVIIALLVLILLAINAPGLLKVLFWLPFGVGALAFALNGFVDKPLYYALRIVTGLFVAGGIIQVGTQIENMSSED